MTTALRMYQQALRGTKGDVYGALEAVYQKNPQSGQILLDTLGGKDLISDISNQHASDIKAASAAESAEAEQKAREPYIEDEHRYQEGMTNQEHQFQAGLVRETAKLNKGIADEQSRNLKADEMSAKEANDRDSDLKNVTDLQNNLAQMNEGNQTAMNTFKTKFAEHEIVEGGVKRMNQAELEALTSKLGTFGRQFQSWTDSGFKGDMPTATKNEMAQILNAEVQSRNQLYNRRVGNINKFIRGTTAPSSQPSGQGTPQPRIVPAGATPGRDAQGNIIGYKTPTGQVVTF
jgi:hypothetical protein